MTSAHMVVSSTLARILSQSVQRRLFPSVLLFALLLVLCGACAPVYADATPPTITAIADQVMVMGTSLPALAFTVGDAVTSATALKVTGASSNLPLIAPVNFYFSGTGASRTVKLHPIAGQSGVATITLTVTDGAGLSTAMSFMLTVNAPPTVTTIASQLINMGTSTSSLAFTVGDSVTPLASLTVACTARNTALVPASGIVLTGPDTQGLCTVTLTPVAIYSGVSVMTITVTNASALTAKTSFTLTVNHPPTITKIANQTINVGSSTSALAFTIGDDLTPVSSLALTGSSSNSTLIALANMYFTGTGAARTVTLHPVSGQTGTAIITLTVNDGDGLITSMSFTFTVNAPPTITAIAKQTINIGKSTSVLAFTVADDLTAATALKVTGASSNTTLVPASGIVFSGSGATRDVTVTSAAGLFGVATITLTVSDGGGLTAKTSFLLSVYDPPTISIIPDQTINMNLSTVLLPFTVGDSATPVGTLTVSGLSNAPALFPAIRIIFGGSGANRTVKVTPANNQSGIATVMVTVKNAAGLTATTSFTVTVNALPTISPIAPQFLQPGTDTSALQFTVGDDLTPPVALTLTGISSNPTLINQSNIVLTGPDAQGNCTVTVTPTATYSGIATVTLTVTDSGGLFAKTSFLVMVVPMVSVSAGSFTMGTTFNPVGNSPTTQTVTLSAFTMYTYPVTVAQYRAFCTATGHALPTFPSGYSWTGKTGWSDATVQQFPIVNVSWMDASMYAGWVGGSLPTEAQYEYAARGAAENNYPWGGTATAIDPYNGWSSTNCANYLNSYTANISTWPVGSFPSGASWCGAQDLAGNVWEWCADWYGDYSSSALNNPTGPSSGTYRVLRGGSWYSYEDQCRSTFRSMNTPDFIWMYDGFRVVLNSSSGVTGG